MLFFSDRYFKSLTVVWSFKLLGGGLKSQLDLWVVQPQLELVGDETQMVI